jgi:hypothetical protein
MYKKILLFMVAAASLACAQTFKKTVLCSSDAQCPSGDLCVRDTCMDIQQLRVLAEVYAPKEAVVAVQNQFAMPQCKIDADCEQGFDRCFKGACISSESVTRYRMEASKTYANYFGETEIPVQKARSCVTETQCIAGDICFDGQCLEYFSAESAI